MAVFRPARSLPRGYCFDPPVKTSCHNDDACSLAGAATFWELQESFGILILLPSHKDKQKRFIASTRRASAFVVSAAPRHHNAGAQNLIFTFIGAASGRSWFSFLSALVSLIITYEVVSLSLLLSFKFFRRVTKWWYGWTCWPLHQQRWLVGLRFCSVYWIWIGVVHRPMLQGLPHFETLLNILHFWVMLTPKFF